MLHLKVLFLDDTQKTFSLEPKATGKDFFFNACEHLNLAEKEYFGLDFRNDTPINIWVELLKPITKQCKSPQEILFRFKVKFFPPDPGQLQEMTRYLFTLQLKQDLTKGQLPCNETSAALLVSHLLQAELGDYSEDIDREHLDRNQYLPNQEYLDNLIMQFHRKHMGQSPAESDIKLLDIARKLDMYGIRPHSANDGEGMKINLAVTHMGVLVLQGNTKINTFNWAKIRKLSFKRKNFLIKLHANVSAFCKDTLEFTMSNRDTCKAFWKLCVEYHAFFRLAEEPKSKNKPLLYSKGSKFRYSGRTQKQLLEHAMKKPVKHPQFERKHCKVQYDTRHCRSSPDILSEVSKQANDIRYMYSGKEGFGELHKKHSHSMPEGKRRNSAVEVVFAAELERSKPEADPASLQQQRNSSSFSYLYYTERDNKPDVLKGQRNTVCFPLSDSFVANNMSRPLGIRDDSIQYLRSRESCGIQFSSHSLEKPSPRLMYYEDRTPQLSRRTSGLVEEIIRSSSISSPVSISPSSRRLNAIRNSGIREGRAARNSCGSILHVAQEDRNNFSNNPTSTDIQKQVPKRSWSQSDMKALKFTQCGSEFKPLGPCPALTRKPTAGRYMLPQQVAAEHSTLYGSEQYASSRTEYESSYEPINHYYYPAIGRPVKPLARVRLSSGSLQLDEEEENVTDYLTDGAVSDDALW
ncbi:FERM domain-containing protein 7 [Protopterus annectens]|uniref:FERM domain-containing protein 7 n=1 Tax=Protopterus annectens TaxID=7888 RepID=UPI001CFBC467|nr:FERM domain-containing protein 7 [Protopterus annectens]